jgi:hypothetical protein
VFCAASRFAHLVKSWIDPSLKARTALLNRNDSTTWDLIGGDKKYFNKRNNDSMRSRFDAAGEVVPAEGGWIGEEDSNGWLSSASGRGERAGPRRTRRTAANAPDRGERAGPRRTDLNTQATIGADD